jgi:hypothetical protein
MKRRVNSSRAHVALLPALAAIDLLYFPSLIRKKGRSLGCTEHMRHHQCTSSKPLPFDVWPQADQIELEFAHVHFILTVCGRFGIVEWN